MDSGEGSVEGLKGKLYSRRNRGEMSDVRTPLSPQETEVDVSWGPPPLPPAAHAAAAASSPRRRWSVAAKFLIGSAIFFVVALAAAAYFFFGGGNFISPNNIDIQIVAPSLIDGGAPATIQYIITNHNSTGLTLSDIVIQYPDGTREASDTTQTLPSERQDLGDIAPGQQVKRTSTAVFYGSEGQSENLQVTLEYSVPGSDAVFTKEANLALTIGSSPVSLTVNSPSEAIADQPFSMDVTVRSNSTSPISDVTVEAQYPFGFTVTDASPEADTGGTIWRLGTLSPGQSEDIKVTGTIDGQDGDQRVFRFLVGSQPDLTAAHVTVPFLSVPATVTVEKPFISASIAINGNSGTTVSASPGTPIQGSITWQNNLTTPVSGVQVSLTLAGAVLNKSSITSTTGFYQSASSSIIWTSSQDPSLAQVPPGGTGTLDFSFASLPVGQGGTVYGNPEVDLNVTVQATRTDQNNAQESVTSAASTAVEFASQVSLTAQSLRSGAYATSGPVPPIAGQTSTYNVLWTVKNSSNDIANASVSAVLPPYVDFVEGQSGVTYDSTTRSVTWTIGDVAAGAGWSGAADTAAFEVALDASASQSGTAPSLTGTAQLTGTDRFAQVPVSASADGPTTATSDGASGVVAQ